MYLIKISSKFFEKMLESGQRWDAMIETGLPGDCKLELVRFKYDEGLVELFFSHPNKTGDITECQIQMKR